MNPGAQLSYFHILPAPHQRGNRRTVPQIVDGQGKGIGSIQCHGQSSSVAFSNTRQGDEVRPEHLRIEFASEFVLHPRDISGLRAKDHPERIAPRLDAWRPDPHLALMGGRVSVALAWCSALYSGCPPVSDWGPGYRRWRTLPVTSRVASVHNQPMTSATSSGSATWWRSAFSATT